MDSIQMGMATCVLYLLFIHCRINKSPNCFVYLPWELTLGTFIVYWLTFMVQVFYAHRVWIISGQNRVLTFLVIALATAQLSFGLMIVAEIIRNPTFEALSNSRYTALSAMASAICDIVITLSVFYHLRPARTGIMRKGNIIKRLNLVFVQMGLLSFTNALAMVVLFYIQDHQLGLFLTTVPGMILGKTYANSMLAVLNARKSLRDQQRDSPRTMELPTIPTIY
ncbi:hypothetical protein BS17DRAFT_343090 [Gyrodon lividus]|nr:hypothetical protein BS17DRAFT_343090 [Gyrodon lividus]